MSTRPKDIPDSRSIRDTDARLVGVARMAELRQIEKIKAEATALFYRATGTVSRDVPVELHEHAYDNRRGKLNPLGAIDRYSTILQHRTRRNLSRAEARRYAEQMLVLAQQLIDVKLPVGPTDNDPSGMNSSHPNRCRSHAPASLGPRLQGSVDELPEATRLSVRSRSAGGEHSDHTADDLRPAA